MDVRERILRTYNRLAFGYGFRNIAMERLAREAGISKKTVYKYFAAKEELVETAVMSVVHGPVQEIDRVLADESLTPGERLIAAARLMLQLLGEFSPAMLEDLRLFYPAQMEKIDRIRRDRMDRASSLIGMAIADGEFRDDINTRVASGMIMVLIENAFSHDFIKYSELNPDEVLKNIFSIFLLGVAKR